MTKKKEVKKLWLNIAEVENGYTVRTSTGNYEDEYGEKTHVFLTSNALVEYIKQLF